MEKFSLISPAEPMPPGELIGRDEMNLAEFPITLLTDRAAEGQNTICYKDRHGTLTVTAPDASGMPTAADADVIVALIQLTKKKNNFSDPVVNFTRYELIKILNWQDIGKSYRRLSESLHRWAAVTLRYQGTWWNNDKKQKVNVTMHILDTVILYDRTEDTGQSPLPLSSFRWNKDFLDSCQAGNLKSLNLTVYFSLKHPSSKRLYRFLDKRFNGRSNKAEHVFPLDEIAITRVGLSPNYAANVAKLKEKLQPAIDELEKIGFLVPLPRDERYRKEAGQWTVHFLRPVEAAAQPTLEENKSEPLPPLAAELARRGVTEVVAADLARQHPAELIEKQIEVFDWLMEKQDKKVAKNSAGYLVESIRTPDGGYKAPKGFISRADRDRQAAAKRQAEEQTIQERRQKQAEEIRLQQRRQKADEHWSKLTPTAQADLEAKALAAASEEARDDYLSMKRQGLGDGYLSQLRREYILALIDAEHAEEPA